MNKIINTIRGRVKKALSRIRHRGRLAATAGIITFYILCCLLYWYVEFDRARGAGFLDVILWNTATLFGQDFADHYPVSVAGRLLGLVLLLIGMFGVSAITGYISSALIEHNMNSMRGMKKLQSLRNHVIICGWKDDLKDLLRNRAWWVLLSAGIAAVIFNSIRDGAAVYYFKYYVGNDPAWLAGTGLSLTTLFLVSGQAANILGILLVTPVSGRIGKKNTFFGSMAIAGILSLVFMSVGKDAVWLMLLLQILISMCAGSIFPLLWSMYADIADYSELKTGRRATGLIFSSSSMSQKFGWALGGTLSGWLLAHYGFQANMVQDEAVLGGIRSMMGILPAVACAVSSLCVAFYPLSEKKVLETSRRLAALRDAGKHFEGE